MKSGVECLESQNKPARIFLFLKIDEKWMAPVEAKYASNSNKRELSQYTLAAWKCNIIVKWESKYDFVYMFLNPGICPFICKIYCIAQVGKSLPNARRHQTFIATSNVQSHTIPEDVMIWRKSLSFSLARDIYYEDK